MLPTLRVDLDDGTGSFPYDITGRVLAVNGYTITRGRDDWQDATNAGDLTLTLNNSDGRFTPGSTILDTPSPITVDQRIRVTESLPGIGAGFGLVPFGSGGFGSAGASARAAALLGSGAVAEPKLRGAKGSTLESSPVRAASSLPRSSSSFTRRRVSTFGLAGSTTVGASRPATTEASALTTVIPASTFFTMEGFMTSPGAK